MNLLVLTPLVPYPPHDGDKLRLFHFLSYLKKRGHHIDLFCVTRVQKDLDRSGEMTGLCDRLYLERLTDQDLFFNLLGGSFVGHSLNVASHFSPRLRDTLREYWLSPAGKKVDVVLAHRLRMAPMAFESNPGKPVVLELTDCLTAYSGQLKKQEGAPFLRRMASRWDHWFLKKEEPEWAERAFQSLLISGPDAESLVELGVTEEKVLVVPNGVRVPPGGRGKRPGLYPAGKLVVCFAGNMGYAPNEDAALWMIEHVWPLVRESFPGALFACVGGEPRARLLKKANGSDVIVTGWVPEIEPYLSHADVSVAPLRVASGMQNKVAQSMALGVPTVASAQAVRWLPKEGRILLRVPEAEGPDQARAFADGILDCLKRRAAALSRARRAKVFIRKNYSWEKSGRVLEKILLDAKNSGSKF